MSYVCGFLVRFGKTGPNLVMENMMKSGSHQCNSIYRNLESNSYSRIKNTFFQADPVNETLAKYTLVQLDGLQKHDKHITNALW